MSDRSSDILLDQINALGSNPAVIVEILKIIDSSERGATYKEIKEKISERMKIKILDKSLYSYLSKLTKAGILESDDRKPKSWTIKTRLLPLTKVHPPIVRFEKPDEANWGAKGRKKISESLINETSIDPEIAAIVAQRVEEYANALGYAGMKRIWKLTIRSLVVEALKEMTEDPKYEDRKEFLDYIQFKYNSISWSLKWLKESLERPSYHGIHLQSPDRLVLSYINLKRLPSDLYISSDRGTRVYLHGLHRIFEPLSINHDMRWFFAYGVKSPLHNMRPPKHLNSALACICAVLAMCQQEVGGSQNIDHFNLVIAPFAEELKKGQYYDRDLVNHIDAFISETWRLFLTRPYEPVFSSITLEFENSPVEKCDVFKGEMKGNQYCEYWNDAREIANVLIETMYSKVEDYAYLPIYPRVFLKISINSLKNEEIISSQTLETLLSILMRSDPVNNPLYFMNMDSEMNKVPDSHVSYSSEIQRITPNGTKDDQGKGVLTFASLNLQKIIGEGAKLDEENFEKILSDIEKLVKIVVSFDAKKRTHLKDRLSGKLLPHLYLLAQPDPLTRGNTYFDVDHSSLHIGLVGLRDFFTGNIDEKDSETVEDKVKIIVVFLNQLKRMLYNLSNTYGTPIYLSQTPSRSGAYSRFFNKKDPPPEYINILPIIYEFKDFEKQLMLENKIHSVMLGGSISRIYIPIKEFPRNSEEFRDILTRAIKTGVPLFRIIPQDFKSILKEYQSKQS